MTLRKLITAIAGVVGILGAFLPWYKASLFGYSTSANAFQLGALYIIMAIIALICSAALLVLTLVKEKQIKKTVKIKNFSKITIITGAILVLVAVISFIALKSESQGFGNVSWGIWFIGLAGVCAIVANCLKNVDQLNKVVIGTSETSSKSEKSEKSEKSNKSTKSSK